jgi:hypothetical protein
VRLIARFTVDGFDQPGIDGLEADWVDVLVFRKTFTQGIVGSATTLFQSAGSDGNRAYVATERISGRLSDGEGYVDGSVTVQHGGLESDPTTWFGHVVPGTGTGSFAGWSGAARIVHDADGAYFAFDLTA